MIISGKNIFTVDLEDTIYTADCQLDLPASAVNQIKSTLIKNTNDLLRILRLSNSTATFFVLGKLAEDMPYLIQKIRDEGHEIANHGYDHKSLKFMNPTSFKLDLEQASDAIYKACGINTFGGYRAPYFSINEETFWAIDVLKNLGFDYDSSIQPFGYHPQYGSHNLSTNINIFKNGLIEIPLSVAKVSNFRIPCSGGAYFRFYPYKLFSGLYRKSIIQNNYSIFYIHPWELSRFNYNENSCKIALFRKYYNSENTVNKLEKFVTEFKFVSIRQFLNKFDNEYAY